MEKIFIDATNTQIGRIATFTVKQTLRGNKVFVLNSAQGIISGNKKDIIEKWRRRRAMGGSALKGPYHSKDPEKILKRTIRGMLPNYRSGRGRVAWKNIKCHNEVPEEYSKEKITTLKIRLPKKYIQLKELKEKL
jgi:large subunit ribosomal protein L13